MPILGLDFTPVKVPHGGCSVYGFRVGELGYVTDAKSLPPAALDALAGVRVLVLNALWFGRPHRSHFNIEEAIEAAELVGAERTYLHAPHPPGDAPAAARRAARRCAARLRRTHRGGLLTVDRVRLDFGNLVGGRVEAGIAAERWEGELSDRFGGARDVFEQRREAGELGFLDLPYATESLDRVVELAEGFGQWFEDVVVLGIGGSGLGAAMLKEALLGPAWNERSDEGREHFPRLHVLDNPDPHSVLTLLSRVDRHGPVQRREQVGWDRRDDGTVPGGPGARRGGGRAGESARTLPLHHGSARRSTSSDR